ncbi:MAG: putative zinc-binding metallopeptidase [Chitinophagaceae bacterium]
MKFAKSISLILFIASMSSCYKEDALGSVDNISGLGGDTWVKGPIDKWILDTLTVPFNSTVKYKYDQFELSLNRTLVPIKEEKVIPVMSAFKRVWMDTYIAETNPNFLKRYGNKFFVLVGSGSYDPASNSVNLGSTSEDGTKIVIYQLNYFRTKLMSGYLPSDSGLVKEVFRTIEHEFGHVLHRNILYPYSFNQVNSQLYTSDWANISDIDALSEGFVSSYAMSKSDEDFCEMISYMLTEGKAGFDKIVNSINYTGTTSNGTTAAEAQSRLRQKESIIVGYYKQSWNIDFYSLQSRTRSAVNSLLY